MRPKLSAYCIVLTIGLEIFPDVSHRSGINMSTLDGVVDACKDNDTAELYLVSYESKDRHEMMVLTITTFQLNDSAVSSCGDWGKKFMMKHSVMNRTEKMLIGSPQVPKFQRRGSSCFPRRRLRMMQLTETM